MSLNKKTYISKQTAITTENLNDIQDSIIDLENKSLSKTEVESALGYTPANQTALPTKVSDLENDSEFVAKSYVDTASAKDWNQNDATASDYIKNRPGGYEETVPERTLVEYGYYNQTSITLPEPLVVGQEYMVSGHKTIAGIDTSNPDNRTYVAIYIKNQSSAIGALTMTSIDPPTAQINLGQQGASFDVIRSAYTRIVHIPSKYIEDMYYQETTESKVLYDLSTDTSHSGSLTNQNIIYVSEPITLGKTYIVNNKTMAAYGSDDAPALGIYEGGISTGGITFSNEKTDQGYKGLIGCSPNTVIYSLKISTAESAIIHKIPEKYIPSQQFIITLTRTTSDNGATASYAVDKTYDEMIAAYNAGMNLRLTASGYIFILMGVVQEGIDFIASNSNGFTIVHITNQNEVALLDNNFATWDYVDDGIDIMRNNLQSAIDKKVDKVAGKGLSTNDYTTEEKSKLEGIASGAQVNVIETVKVNGVVLTPTDKAVDVTVPTSLKNPNALTIKIGSTTVTYDGSAAKTVEIADGTEVSY